MNIIQTKYSKTNIRKLTLFSKKKIFSFKSKICRPLVQDLEYLENKLMLMIKNIRFKNVGSSFQSQLNKDIKQIKQDSKMFLPADKSWKIYKMEQKSYEKLLHESIPKFYKKKYEKKVRAINVCANKTIKKHFELDVKLRRSKRACYITVIDHKENAPHKI